MKKGVWRLPKFIKNLPEWCPGALRKGFWKNVRTSVSASDSILSNFGATWATLVDFGDPSKSRGAKKRSKKLNTVTLTPRSIPGRSKGCFERGPEKGNDFWLDVGWLLFYFWMFFNDISCFRPLFFWAHFLTICSLFFELLLNRANHTNLKQKYRF